MKISFLIPSKNRLELTMHAIASIRAQPCLDYEIVVVDNASAESYEDAIWKLEDPRIVFKRQEHSVSVTDNWRTSLALATGEYVLMLGDDDALAPCFGSVAADYLAADQPDLVYLPSYHYCYPGVMPGHDAGYLASVLNSEFLQPGIVDPFCLTHDYAVDLARDILKFRYRIGLNAQHYLLKRSFLRQFEGIGGFYQSPYPDTFSSIAALLHARSLVVLPREVVIIGISPKSFGAYYFSGRQEEGYRFLDNIKVAPKIRASLEPVILPGDKNDTNWLIAAEAVRQAFPDALGDSVDVDRYRALQMVTVLRTSPISEALEDLRTRLLPAERPLFAALEACVRSVGEGEARNRMFAAISTEIGQYYPARVSVVDIGRHSHVGDAIDFLRRLEQRSIGEPAQSHPAEPVAVPAPERRGNLEIKEIGEIMRSRVKETLVSLFPPARKRAERQARLQGEPACPEATKRSGLEPQEGRAEKEAVGDARPRDVFAEDAAPLPGETAPPEVAKQTGSEAEQGGSGKVALGSARPWISVYRDGEVFALAVEDIDRFPFSDGDELSVEPSSPRDRWLRTPEGHVHVPVAPSVGVRIPPRISLFEFKGSRSRSTSSTSPRMARLCR